MQRKFFSGWKSRSLRSLTFEGSFSDEAASKETRANLSSSTIPTVFKQYTAAHCTIASHIECKLRPPWERESEVPEKNRNDCSWAKYNVSSQPPSSCWDFLTWLAFAGRCWTVWVQKSHYSLSKIYTDTFCVFPFPQTVKHQIINYNLLPESKLQFQDEWS